MSRMTSLFIITIAAVAVASAALAAPPASAGGTAGPTVAVTEPLRIQPWNLLQHDGAELYQEMCASCHGAGGAGNGPAARALPVATPPLIYLRQAGVPREHWTYVILAGCDDRHHWAPDGTQTMPCWQRIFRQALGHEAAPLMISLRLTDYLESIQK